MTAEMTSAVSCRAILRLVWPLALGMVNNAVMQFVDRMYLARDSMTALEAVLPAGLLAGIVACFFQGIVGYSGVFVAQYHGSGDPGRGRVAFRAALLIALAATACTLPFVPLGNAVLARAAPSASVAALERTYFEIVMAGAVFVYGQMAASAYFTGRGETRLVFWVNVLGNVLNVALDPLFIFGLALGPVRVPALGIAGAAYATVAACAVQFAVLFAAACRAAKGVPYVRGETWRIAGRILRFGVPSGCHSLLSLLSFTVFVFVTGRVGDIAFAVSNACFTVNYLLFAPMEGFALGVQTLAGQARGRGDDAAVACALRRTLALGVGFALAACALVLLFHRPILLFFAPAEAAARAEFLALGLKLLVLMSAWLLFDAADVILSGALKGTGDTRFVMWWMLVSSFLFWMPLVFAVRLWHNTMPALWATMVAYVVVICIGSWLRWRGGRWRSIRMV